ncbi:MAG: hypothetical protein ABJN14_02735 [Paracoccaceae bacterium]
MRAISQKTIDRQVKEEISNYITNAVAEIIEQRGLIDHDQIEFPGFVHEDPDKDFVAAVRDAVQISFVYEVAREHHRMEAGHHDRVLQNAGSKEEVQKFFQELATSHLALEGPSSMHALDEMIAELRASAPWMSDVSTWAHKALRARYNTGQIWLALPPVILIGPPVRTLDVSSSNTSFTVAGCDAT